MAEPMPDAPYEAPTAEDVELCAGTTETASMFEPVSDPG
jgi:hypothetical protein